MGGGKEDCCGAGFVGSKQRRLLRADGVENGTDVVHPLLEQRHLVERNRIGTADPALVHRDQAAERRESLEDPRRSRFLPACLQRQHPVGDTHEVTGTVSRLVVRDMDPVAGYRILRRWHLLHRAT